MGSRRLLIHIGTEKTGTTSIQHFLHRNAGLLEAKGIWYPTDTSRGYCQGTAHFPLAGSLVDQFHDFVSPAKERELPRNPSDLCMDARVRNRPVTVVSSEHFSSRVRDADRLKAFRKTLSSCFDDIRIVCYLRNQADLALSSYATRIIFGGRHGFDPSQITPDDPFYNYLTMLDLWAAAFGHEAIMVHEYDRKTLVGGDACRDFVAKALGIPDDGLSFGREMNPSPGAVLLEVTRQLSLTMPSLEENVAGWRAAQRIRSVLLSLVRVDNDVPLGMAVEERRSLMQRFAPSNREVNTRYMNGTMSANWFDPDLAAAPGKTIDSATLNGKTMNILSKLAIEFLKTKAG